MSIRVQLNKLDGQETLTSKERLYTFSDTLRLCWNIRFIIVFGSCVEAFKSLYVIVRSQPMQSYLFRQRIIHPSHLLIFANPFVYMHYLT